VIVVTGGAGFIGSALVWGLNQAGEHDLLVVDQKAPGSPKERNFGGLRVNGYLESDAFLDNLERDGFRGYVRAIFHMGATTDTTETDAALLRRNNTEYTRRLAEWAVKHGVYFAYASSAATYGAGELGYSDDDVLTPRLKPLNPYGRSKLDFDAWALQSGTADRITGFRFFNVYGPNEYHKGEMRSMVHKGFEQIARAGAMRLFKSYRKEYPDGGQKRDFVYVKDVVETVLWFWRNPGRKGIYNLGAGRAETWNDLAAALFKAMAKPPAIEYIEMPPALRGQYQYFTQADLTKLRKAGCPVVFRNLEQGVGDYVRNYLSTTDPYLKAP
jgi:ADP-L-glycero-D-manno-heptose 6-epimerase